MIIRRMKKIWHLLKYYWSFLVFKWNYIILTMKSLFYNEFTSTSYVLECAMTPVFCFIEHFARYFGRILVATVVLLTSSIILTLYVIGQPYYWAKSPSLTIFLNIIGHWFLLNIVFHFYMGATTDPGSPENSLVSQIVTICKKCISPKPPRTHHCSVCNKCVLKMDHHCPWLNNCIGHFNHRFFFMYMIYMILATFFVMCLGFQIFYDEVWCGSEYSVGWSDAFYYKLGWLEPLPEEYDRESGNPAVVNDSHVIPMYEGQPMEAISMFDEHEHTVRSWRYFFIVYTSMLITAALFSLVCLSGWHARRISRGETSIENLINKKETKRLAALDMVYKNPYDFGLRENWKNFLGLHDKRGLFHLLFPSSHMPSGDGLTWSTNHHDKAA